GIADDSGTFSLQYPVPAGNIDFLMQIHIPTPYNIRPDYVIRLNLWDADEHLGCVRFVRHSFT
ncbi:39262_t:CDS:1, partial [Gigaspora margarita]